LSLQFLPVFHRSFLKTWPNRTAGSAGLNPPRRVTTATGSTCHPAKGGAIMCQLIPVRPTANHPVPCTCPDCQEPLAAKFICWTCCDRLCSTCGRPTGSAFIEVCWQCEFCTPNTMHETEAVALPE